MNALNRTGIIQALHAELKRQCPMAIANNEMYAAIEAATTLILMNQRNLVTHSESLKTQEPEDQ